MKMMHGPIHIKFAYDIRESLGNYELPEDDTIVSKHVGV
jgi:hypothetical protein